MTEFVNEETLRVSMAASAMATLTCMNGVDQLISAEMTARIAKLLDKNKQVCDEMNARCTDQDMQDQSVVELFEKILAYAGV